jgi:hypothetical protein
VKLCFYLSVAFALSCQLSFADLVTQYRGYVASRGFSPDIVNTRGSPITVFRKPDGSLDFIRWSVRNANLEKPSSENLPTIEEAEAAIEAYYANKEAARQAAKPLEQRQYENQFFSLIEELYNVTGVTNEVTPKLGFPEIRELIDTVQASDPMAAVNYSLELLSIDAALKRYSVLWWDDAIQHDIVP